MLAYAADTASAARRAGSPKALTLIIAGHAALIMAVMTARMDIIRILPGDPTDVINVPIAPPPPPQPRVEPKQPRPATQPSFIERVDSVIDMDATSPSSLAQGTAIEDIATVIGTNITLPLDPPRHVPVRIGARLATAESALKPPYPTDKLRLEEEATLKLRLSIDTRGRVTAVEPVGEADPSFLTAARRHILRAWRYKPATEDGVAVPFSTVITLSFRLDDA